MNTENSRLVNQPQLGNPGRKMQCGQTSTLSPITAHNDPLWSRLVEFRFDTPGTTFQFATRLAQENGWTPAFTERVLEEYLRFLFLAMRAGHPVSPSDAVDQAWHLHLLYTESYWGDLCPHVLGQPFHHGPSKGGAAEDRKFTDWYERTSDSYARFFGQHPPADIWPPVATRFRGRKRHQRVCLNDAWVIPKPRWPRRRTAFTAVGFTALPVILAEASSDASAIPVFLFWGVVFVILAIVVVKSKGSGKGPGGSGCGGADCGAGGGDGGSSHHGGNHGGHDGGSHGGHDGGGGGHSCGGHSCGGGHGCGGSSCGGGGH